MMVTRKGQAIIPELREKYGLREGTKLDVIDTGEGILLKKALSTGNLIGTSNSTYNQLKRHLTIHGIS